VTDAFDFLDDQVDAFGSAVGESAGGVEREDLGLPCRDGLGQSDQFGDGCVGNEVVEHNQSTPGMSEVAGGVDLAAEFFGLWVPDIRSWVLTRHDGLRSSSVVHRIVYRFFARLARLAGRSGRSKSAFTVIKSTRCDGLINEYRNAA
jgi:hypothetical protein